MSCHSSNSLVTTSDYSISEDDVYVFCRIASGPVDATKCQLSEGRHPAVESQIRCDRDPGFSEHEYSVEGFYTEISDLLMFKHNPESQKTCLERDDHVYYNLSSLREEKEACNYNNYPLLNVKALKKLNELLPKKKMHTKRTRPKPRSMDSQQSDISTMTVFSAVPPYRRNHENATTTQIFGTMQNHGKVCCVQCREEELRRYEECWKGEDAKYDFHNVAEHETIELYGRLIRSAIIELRSGSNGLKRALRLQQKIEDILQLQTDIDLTSTADIFEKAVEQFGDLIERRLRAINDVSPSSYQKLTSKLCYIQSTARRQNSSFIHLSSVRNGLRKVWGLLWGLAVSIL